MLYAYELRKIKTSMNVSGKNSVKLCSVIQLSLRINIFDTEPQPVPPIFQPSVAAEAIYYAAYHKRREMYIGLSTTMVLIGNKFFPGVADRYLSRMAFKLELSKKKTDPFRQDNLWKPVENIYGTEGRFSDRAVNKSYHFVINKNRHIILLVLFIIIILILIL